MGLGLLSRGVLRLRVQTEGCSKGGSQFNWQALGFPSTAADRAGQLMTHCGVVVI